MARKQGAQPGNKNAEKGRTKTKGTLFANKHVKNTLKLENAAYLAGRIALGPLGGIAGVLATRALKNRRKKA